MTRPQAMETARRMWANGEGWRIGEIRRYLADHGHAVDDTTVRTWADPEYARRRRAQEKIRKRQRARDRGVTSYRVLDDDARRRLGLAMRPPSELTPELLLSLRTEDKLAYNAIAAIARRFFGESMTEDQVRHRLYELGAPKNPNKSRSAALQHRLRTAA